ncbi:hypothetical protein QUC31_005869 [Theobroma cacao]
MAEWDAVCQKEHKSQEDKPGYNSSGERKTKCCPRTTKKGEGGFMNMFWRALGCCGVLSACYEPKTSQP